jgi:hypothetical protein
MNRREPQSLLEGARSIPLKEGDPFCIGENPDLADEFESSIPKLIQLPKNGSKASDIAQYLGMAGVELGVRSPSGSEVQAAKQLLEACL